MRENRQKQPALKHRTHPYVYVRNPQESPRAYAHYRMVSKNAKSASKSKERSNLIYMQKLIKKSNTTARGAVQEELNSMLMFLMNNLNSSMGSILEHYVKKGDTLKSKVVQAALQATLSGELRELACNAGTEALAEFIESNKQKNADAAEKKKKKKKAVEDAPAVAEAESAVAA